MKKVSMERKYNLMKSIIVIAVYLLYSIVFNSIAEMFDASKSILVNFIADMFFLVFILVMYRDKIKSDKENFNKNGFKRRASIIIGWIIIIFITNIVGTYLSTLLSTKDTTSNNMAILSLPYIYTFFKTLIFSSIAEELVFKQSIRDVIDNNAIFLIVSTLIYSTLNIAYTNSTGWTLIADSLPYIIFACTSGILYLKHKDNIYVVMIVKVCYNLIPFAVMLLGGIG